MDSTLSIGMSYFPEPGPDTRYAATGFTDEGLNVTEREWDRMVEIFIGVLEHHRVPPRETEELLGILGPNRDEIVVTEGGS